MIRHFISVRALWRTLPFLVIVPVPLAAQTITVDTVYDSTAVVTGQADPTLGPFVVYDMSYEVPAAIGRSNVVDTNGNYAIAVTPPLMDGNSILVEDAQGNQSQPIEILPSPDIE